MIPYRVKIPEPPKIEPYEIVIIKNVKQLRNFLLKCTNEDSFSFDYETGPRQKFKNYKAKIDAKCREKLIDLLIDAKAKQAIAKTEKDKVAIAKAINKAQRTIEVTRANGYKSVANIPFNPHMSEVCTISMCSNKRVCGLVFINMPGNATYKSSSKLSDIEEVFSLIKEIIFTNDKVVKIAYNLEFEALQSLSNQAYIVKPVIDPLVLIVRCLQVIRPDEIVDVKRPASGKGLKAMALQYLDVEMQNFDGLLEKYDVNYFNELSSDNEDAQRYAAEDSIYSLYLAEMFVDVASAIPVESGPYNDYLGWLLDIEMPFMRVLGQMKYFGMTWNKEKADETETLAISKQLESVGRIQSICNEVCDLLVESGIPDAAISKYRNLNPGKTGKTKIVKDFLFDILDVPTPSISPKTGAPSMDKEAMMDMKFLVENNLKNLDEEKILLTPLPKNVNDNLKGLTAKQIKAYDIKTRSNHFLKQYALDLLKAISDTQKFGTLLSSHIEGRQKYVDPVTHRIHCSYTPWTETARTNSSKPNGQNVPRFDNDPFKIRSLYQAAKSKILVLIDYAGFELRLMAWQSGDINMLKLLNEGGDLHAATAAAMTGKPIKDITKSERSLAKAGNFGINYGGSEYSLQSTLKKMGIRESLENCTKIVEAIKIAYPNISKYQRNIALKASKQGFISTIYGYKRLLPSINSRNRSLRNTSDRQASNTPIQGSAADIMKRAQNEIYDYIAKRNLHGKADMIAQIHDEIIFELDDNVEFVKNFVNDIKVIMEAKPLDDFPVNILVDVSIATKGWGDKIDYADWLKTKEKASV